MAARDLILASGSPRRRELLDRAGFRFELDSPDIDESPIPGETPEAMVRRLALEKGRHVAARSPADACVLAADTVVVIDGDVLGKPEDEADAARMLLRLAGREHTVFTGYAALVPEEEREEVGAVRSVVYMRRVSQREAEAYAAGGEPLDKAGGYAVQGDGGRFVEKISGSRTNVIGLPIETVVPLLESLGVDRS